MNRKQKRKIILKKLSKELKKKEEEEILKIEERLKQEAPPKGINPLIYDQKENNNLSSIYFPAALTFSELPISQKTLKGLTHEKFINLTEIQRAAIPHALCGRDILGAAKTGSGKTLAFLVPLLEKLFRLKWNKIDGIGAIIITPTRELAVQIFEVLRAIGHAHNFSAGLIIGGKDLKHEQNRINRMNILICTPGRLLQHMDETIGFDCSNLQILILDEADRILDMGFSETLNAILQNLPINRQTLLFSATQTKSIRDLARLSLKDPEYISVHEKSEFATPPKLIQHIIMINLQEKIDTLYNFIKTHKDCKILVFFSSCKQVRFIFETFRRLQPGISLMAIHGKVDQTKRMGIYFEFIKKKTAVLFATDIAARGLDFPNISWVLQVDCPEDINTYIHRVGRTARYESGGQSLLFLLPSEKKMIELLQTNKIPIKIIKINSKLKKKTIQPKLEGFLSESPELKYLAQKAFITYMRSIWLQKNKEVFNVHELPAAEFAKSMGLPGTPKIKFIKTQNLLKNKKNNSNKIIQELQKEISSENDDENKKIIKTKQTKLFTRKNIDVLSESWSKLREYEQNENDNNEEIFILKRKNHDIEEDDNEKFEEKIIQKEFNISNQQNNNQINEKNFFEKKQNLKRQKIESIEKLSLEEQEKLALQILENQNL